MILNGRMFKFSVPTPGDHRSPLRTDGVSCAKSRAINGNLPGMGVDKQGNMDYDIFNHNFPIGRRGFYEALFEFIVGYSPVVRAVFAGIWGREERGHIELRFCLLRGFHPV